VFFRVSRADIDVLRRLSLIDDFPVFGGVRFVNPQFAPVLWISDTTFYRSYPPLASALASGSDAAILALPCSSCALPLFVSVVLAQLPSLRIDPSVDRVFRIFFQDTAFWSTPGTVPP